MLLILMRWYEICDSSQRKVCTSIRSYVSRPESDSHNALFKFVDNDAGHEPVPGNGSQPHCGGLSIPSRPGEPTPYEIVVSDQVPEGAALVHGVEASGKDTAVFLFERELLLQLSRRETRVLLAQEVGHLARVSYL